MATPRLLLGGLSGRIYVTTAYTEDDKGNIVSSTKYDVTEDYLKVQLNRALDELEAWKSRGKVADA